MWIRKTSGVPGAAPGGLEWRTLDDVIEVDDDLGAELLDIPGAGFVEVAAPAEIGETPSQAGPAGSEDSDPTEITEAPGSAESTDQTEVSDTPSRRRTRKDSTATE
ncbi:hypothetical protein LN042_11330 [Kitasatospora sp. RB6PN24]|uniref:hypothetical protein n=1 Tax=Kitasatospora humi TaxID=2893891 RepID=UPI001E4D5B1E|nr:hypothetical protein [Kitasatospora humi]MCC9307687.1 hypothetical protein [Kitasatospora humi]